MLRCFLKIGYYTLGASDRSDGTAGVPQPILPALPQSVSLHNCQLLLLPLQQGYLCKMQPRGNSRCPSEPRHNRSPLIPIPSTLACFPHIHPPIIQGSPYSIHPSKPRPPSSISPINSRIHHLFQQPFIIHPFQMAKPSQNIHIYSGCNFSPHTRSCSRHFIPNPIQSRYTNHTLQAFHLKHI
ncbi:hypothetical protein SK128_020216 [Halocaridina rubra]|uniref:Uncharacterized protein n=1 Tax=Halocaridina rubra TaxID=373956 RepID=A0AAN8XCU8_HALRR